MIKNIYYALYENYIRIDALYSIYSYVEYFLKEIQRTAIFLFFILKLRHSNICGGLGFHRDREGSLLHQLHKTMSTKLLHFPVTCSGFTGRAACNGEVEIAAKTAEPRPSQFPLCSHNICTVICRAADQFSFAHVPVRQQWVQAFSQVSCCADILHAWSFQTLGLQGPISCNIAGRLMLGAMLTLENISVVAAKSRCLPCSSLLTNFSGLCAHALECCCQICGLCS